MPFGGHFMASTGRRISTHPKLTVPPSVPNRTLASADAVVPVGVGSAGTGPAVASGKTGVPFRVSSVSALPHNVLLAASIGGGVLVFVLAATLIAVLVAREALGVRCAGGFGADHQRSAIDRAGDGRKQRGFSRRRACTPSAELAPAGRGVGRPTHSVAGVEAYSSGRGGRRRDEACGATSAGRRLEKQTRMRVSLTSASMLALTLSVGTVGAQSRDAAKADALFREGRALLMKGEYETACPKLEESYRLDPAPGAGINLGDCFEKVGKVASALLAYQAAFGLLRASDPRVAPVKQEITALEKRVPRLTIKLAPGAPEGTKVKRDGRFLEPDKLGTSMVVNPGKHTLVVSAPGRDHRSYHPELGEGDTRELVVAIGEETSASRGSAMAATGGEHRGKAAADGALLSGSAPGSAQRTAGYLLTGLGVAGIATGAVFWKLATDTHSEACPKAAPGANGCDDLNNKEHGQRQVATITGFGGLIALAGGIGLVLLAPDSPNGAGALRAAPTVSRSTWAINVGGVW